MSDDCERIKDILARLVTLENNTLHLREVMELKFQNTDTASKVETVEIGRRLDILNGEADRLKSMQANYLPRELYDKDQRRVQDNFVQNRRASLTATVSAIGSLLLFILSWILRTK